jgi:hypothetical protein
MARGVAKSSARSRSNTAKLPIATDDQSTIKKTVREARPSEVSDQRGQTLPITTAARVERSYWEHAFFVPSVAYPTRGPK